MSRQRRSTVAATNPLPPDERKKTPAAVLADIDRYLTAPPRGEGVILDAPQQDGWTELSFTFRRRDPDSSPVHAIGRALILHACVADVVDVLCVPSGRAASESNPIYTDDRVVGAIRNLWRPIPAGRLEVETWGEDIMYARNWEQFRCVLGNFASATKAVQELAETVLEEAWRVGQEAAPPPGPPFAIDDLPFESNGHVPPFRVDWWYSVLPALRRDCSNLGSRFGVDAERSDGWEVALQQEIAAIKRRWRRNVSADANVLQDLHQRAKWCLDFASMIFITAVHPELKLSPEIDKDAYRALEAFCRGDQSKFQPELEALSGLHPAGVSFGSLTARNAHAICFEFGRRVLDASHHSKEKLTSLELPDDAQINAAVKREYDSIRQGNVAKVASPLDKLGSPPTPLQRLIWQALDGQAMTKVKLAKACKVDEVRLYAINRKKKTGGLTELQKLEIVMHKHGIGYYRPDALPTDKNA